MKYRSRNLLFALLTLIVGLLFFGCSLFPEGGYLSSATHRFINTYAAIDWQNANYHDANFHTHTRLSDGSYDPHTVIDMYLDGGYSILALTDHDSHHYLVKDEPLFPWTAIEAYYEEIVGTDSAWEERANEPWENRDDSSLNMVSIQGSEISRTHHISSLFNAYAGAADSEEVAFQAIQSGGGIAVFNHPGRYDESTDWYLDFFNRYDMIVGIEVFNQNNRYPTDWKLWDRLLHHSMPERPIWGFANDDMHSASHFGANRNVFPLQQLTAMQVRSAMENGRFYMFRPYNLGDPASAHIDGVEITEEHIALSLDGDYKEITWITFFPQTGRSLVVATGESCSLTQLPATSTYVRAKIALENGIIYTQPFGIALKD